MVSNPKISCRSNDFFTSIVEIVAKRSDLRFELEDAKKTLFMNDQHIPILGRSEKPWKNDLRFTDVDSIGRQSAVTHNRMDKPDEAIHVFPAKDCISPRALARIDDPASA